MRKDSHRPERRRHTRAAVRCPIDLTDPAGGALAGARTINLSDGGALVQVPLGCLPACNSRVCAALSIPRTTPNTYMVERMALRGTVIRHQPLKDERFVGVAVQFEEPCPLGLSVQS